MLHMPVARVVCHPGQTLDVLESGEGKNYLEAHSGELQNLSLPAERKKRQGFLEVLHESETSYSYSRCMYSYIIVLMELMKKIAW